MRFHVIDRRAYVENPGSYPFVVLRNDSWDDYTFRTLFLPRLHLSANEVVDLEGVKILRLGQAGGRTSIEPEFESLSSEYCSLGQSRSYYDRLLSVPSEIRHEYLSGLRDVSTFAPGQRKRVEGDDGFKTSLLRNGTEVLDYAVQTLHDEAEADEPAETDPRLRDAIDLVSATTSNDVKLRALRQTRDVLAEWVDFDDERHLFATVIEVGIQELEAFVRDERPGRTPETILKNIRTNIEQAVDWANGNRYFKFAATLSSVLAVANAVARS
ncbi:MAG: hypothetical protein O2822_06825 [Chloroflexi bacterium]|nr:hypothetical protein [Chloroflexota bacterium]